MFIEQLGFAFGDVGRKREGLLSESDADIKNVLTSGTAGGLRPPGKELTPTAFGSREWMERRVTCPRRPISPPHLV